MTPFRKSKDTPPEQLLRVIEGSTAAPGASAQDAAAPRPEPPLKRLAGALQDVTSRLAQLVLPSHRDADAFLWNLRVAHRVLWVVLAGLGIYLLADVLAIRPTSRLAGRLTAPKTAPGAPDSPANAAGDTSALRSLSEYVAAAQRRNPFVGTVATAAKATSKTTKKRLADLAAEVVVVGIDRGPNPIALLEHTAQQRTYMVKVGDDANGMTVKHISPEGVLVTYEGEELLLK